MVIFLLPHYSYKRANKQTSSYKEKFVILQLIGIIVMKSKETRMVTTPVDILEGT